MTDPDRYREAARRALDEAAPKKLRFGLAGWYEAYADDFAEEARSREGDRARLYEALHEEAQRRGRVLRDWGVPDWLEPGWEDEA